MNHRCCYASGVRRIGYDAGISRELADGTQPRYHLAPARVSACRTDLGERA